MKTNNQSDNSFEKNLICMIKELPEDTPSEGLTLEVMGKLKEVDKLSFKIFFHFNNHSIKTI